MMPMMLLLQDVDEEILSMAYDEEKGRWHIAILRRSLLRYYFYFRYALRAMLPMLCYSAKDIA